MLVLYPIPAAAASLAVRLGVAVASGGGPALEALLEAAKAAGVVADLSIELEVETGLGRGGTPPEDVVAVSRRILDAGATLSGVWTHLQEAEVAAITDEQVRRYEAALAALRAADIAVPRRHLAASAAILLGNVPRYDAVRPGLITYGLIPDELSLPMAGRPRAAGAPPCRSWPARSAFDPPSPSAPVRSGSRSCPPAMACRTARRGGQSGRAGSRPFRSATATAGRDRSRTGPLRSFVASASRRSGTSRWTRR